MDVITLTGIRAYGKHGANPGERDREQPFDVDLEIGVDLRKASRTDDLADTVNYAQIHATVVRIVQECSFALLERLAAEILDAIFVDERIRSASISLAKPQLLDGATPRVTLRRER